VLKAVARVCPFPRLVGALVLAGAITVPAAAASASAPRLGSRTLQEGMSGSDVKTLQHDLSQTGFKVPADGSFGPLTEKAVKSFEHRYKLPVDGVASSAFDKTLLHVRRLDLAAVDTGAGTGGGGLGAPTAPTTPTPPTTTTTVSTGDPATAIGNPAAPVKPDGGSQDLGERVLHNGMSGHDVKELQSYLTLAGFPTSVDGGFGPATRHQVVLFQQANGLVPANGVVTFAVAMAIRKNVSATVTATGASAGGATATLNSDGTVTAPAGAPVVVQNVIAAANSIIDKPYIYGGGHGSFNDQGYDCSGAVSFALHGGGLISSPEDSSQLETYGQSGPGSDITVYSDPSHAFVVIDGLAFDTAHYGNTTPTGSGPRWLPAADVLANLSDGGNYIERHPAGL
jgi:peptidoglycan hydrolase-like protein with peptidoglycan-binding domain